MEIMLRQDVNKKGRLGVKLMIPADRRTDRIVVSEQLEKLGINESTEFLLTPNKKYNLNDPFIKYWIDLAKDMRVIGDKKQMGGSFYYIENIEEDAKEEVNQKEQMLDALIAVKNLSHEDKINLAKVLGVDGSTMTLPVLTNYLYTIAETPVTKSKTNYKSILNILKDPDYDYKLFIAELKFKDLIRFENNQWVYNDTFLGYDEVSVLDFFKAPINEAITNQLKYLIYKPTVEKTKETKKK